MSFQTNSVMYGVQYARALMKYRDRRRGRSLPRHGTTNAVLNIPGFLAPGSVMLPLELRFERIGIHAFTFNLGLYSAMPFWVINQKLRAKLRLIRRQIPELTRLDIVAHSMGGLLAEDLIGCGELGGLDGCLIALGSPFRGTWTALMGCPVSLSAYRMLPVHPRFARQHMNGRLASRPFLSVAGAHDLLVPAESCKHPLAEYEVVQTDHTGLIFRKDVFSLVHQFITAH